MTIYIASNPKQIKTPLYKKKTLHYEERYFLINDITSLIAFVWNNSLNAVKQIEVWNSKWHTEKPKIKVDAGKNIINKANEYESIVAEEIVNKNWYRIEQIFKEYNHIPFIGDEVIFVAGRKVPLSTRGVLKWIGINEYSSKLVFNKNEAELLYRIFKAKLFPIYRQASILVKNGENEFFSYYNNIRRINPSNYNPIDFKPLIIEHYRRRYGT